MQRTCRDKHQSVMIVGKKNIDKAELIKRISSVSSLIEYSDSLVPDCLKYRKEIIYNQRYIVALAIRGILTIPYSDKVSLLYSLLQDVYITGVVDRIYDYEDLLDYVDEEVVERIKQNEREKEIHRVSGR